MLISIIMNMRQLNILSLIFRLLLAVVCGGIIGYERGKHQRAAGLRTHILVCVGSACAMLVGQYLDIYMGAQTDPARIGAQVISGIGFVGAGTIILNSRHQIKGVTTAAGLWASAAMGLAAGAGYYECAILMCLILFTVLRGLNRMDDHYIKLYSDIKVYMEYEKSFHFSEVLKRTREMGWKINFLEPISDENRTWTSIQFVMQGDAEKSEAKEKVLEEIREMEGVWYVDEL